MKILYIGNFEPKYSTENDVRKAFEKLGHTIIKSQENNINWDILNKLDFNLLLITGTWDGLYPLEKWIDLFHKCAESNIPTATIHLDTFWGKSRGGRKWWLHPMFYTAFIFTADGDYQNKWKLFGKNHVWLPPAIRHDATEIGKFREEYSCDVAFVGSNGLGYHEDVWSYRKELVDTLRNICTKNGWIWKNPGGDQPKIERNKDMNDFYASAKITVGDSLCLKKEESHYWSDRLPEAWGRGGFLIMPKIYAIENQGFKQPFYNWGDFEQLENTIKRYINSSEKDEIRDYNFKLVQDDHTYVNRAKEIIKVVFDGK